MKMLIFFMKMLDFLSFHDFLYAFLNDSQLDTFFNNSS